MVTGPTPGAKGLEPVRLGRLPGAKQLLRLGIDTNKGEAGVCWQRNKFLIVADMYTPPSNRVDDVSGNGEGRECVCAGIGREGVREGGWLRRNCG